MADELGAELSLDLDAARREVESFRRDLGDELEKAVSSFSDDYGKAVDDLPSIEPKIESDIVTEELTKAVQATDTDLDFTTDGTTITNEINGAVAAADPEVELDTDAIGAQLTDAVESVHPELTPEIDTTAIASALEGIGSSEIGEGIGAGFSDADLQAQELTDTLGDLQDTGEETGDSLGNVSNVSTTLATAFSAAKGDGRALLSQLGQLGGGLGGTIATVAGVTAGFTALFSAGQRSLQSTERATVVLGAAAGRIEQINVGGLSGSLSELAIRAGSSGGALRNAASNASQMGLSAGKSAGEVTHFANNVNALALRAVALNPALGEAGSVAERLNLVLGRGGRFLNRYQIDLTAAEITARALADTGKTAARDLTSFERSVAGADIAIEKLGNNLGKDFDRGAETATVRLRAIRAELNSAFARAGKDLVEPTIDGFEALAAAGTQLSAALGSLGKAALPVVATGLETLGGVAGTAGEALGLVPGPALAAAAALLLLNRTGAAVVKDIRSFKDVGTVAGLALDNIAGRSFIALGGITALDAGLDALGTSTEELGVQFVTTGAAIGFAIGGPQGAVGGAALGAIAQMISAETDLERATKQVDESFARAESGSGDLRAALFTNADTAVGLAAAIAGLDVNLGNFVRDASAFKALRTVDDLHRLGLSAQEVGQLASEGDAGLTRFIARAQEVGEVSADLRSALEATVPPEVAEKFASEKLKELGVSAHLTAEEFIGLSREQQRYVLSALRAEGSNTDLIVSFQTLLKQIPAAKKAQFDLFAATNNLSPAIVNAARALSVGEDGTRDWTKALGILGDAAVGILPEFGRLTAGTAHMTREFVTATKAITDAAAAIPALGAELSKGFDTSFFEGETLLGKNFLDTDALIGNLEQSADDIRTFFTNIETITNAGASNTAAALLTLGPDNLGARVAAELAANQPLFRDGMEKALEGISEAQLVSEQLLATLRARMTFLAGALGTTLEERLKVEFGTLDISAIATPDLIAFIEKNGEFGAKGAQELVDGYNKEIIARRIAGLDTGPLEESLAKAKATLRGSDLGGDIDVAIQSAQAVINNKAPALGPPIPKAITDVQPAVVAGIGQIGDVIVTGTAKTKDEYDAEFSKIIALTQGTIDKTKGVAENGSGAISDAVARSVQTAIDAQIDDAYARGAALGASITYGIGAGLNSDAAARAVQEGIDRQLDDIDNYFKGQAGINSPARMFIPIGSSIAEGVGVGIETGMKDVALGFAAMTSLSGRGAPQPPSGASPFKVQVQLDGTQGGTSVDQSIHVGAVHQYDARRDGGQGLIRTFRDLQYLGS